MFSVECHVHADTIQFCFTVGTGVAKIPTALFTASQMHTVKVASVPGYLLQKRGEERAW